MFVYPKVSIKEDVTGFLAKHYKKSKEKLEYKNLKNVEIGKKIKYFVTLSNH